jgi:subtilisin family serine protease
MMVSCRFGGSTGDRLDFQARGDLLVVRSQRRGAKQDLSPLARGSREAMGALRPLFGFPSAGVGVYAAPEGDSAELASVINADPEVQFAGQGLRDQFDAPVVYTENVFIKFADQVSPSHAERVLSRAGLTVKRAIDYAGNGYFTETPEGTGQTVFEMASDLLDREDVELCHPEFVREINRRTAFPQQWHLAPTEIGGQGIDAHAHVAEAWKMTRGHGATICVIDDGVDIDHEEFATTRKIIGACSMTKPRGRDPRPGDGDNHGTACAGVACARGKVGASGVAPSARLMPVRLVSGLGSQDEADAIAWAADHGADVISCSWGPVDGAWWNPKDPIHKQVVPLPDSTRLAIDYAVTKGRDGRGCVITWAAGNGAESVDNDGYASYEKVIAVAACNDTSTRSVYSDFGKAILCTFPSSNGEPSLTPGIWTTDRSGHAGYNPGSLSQGDHEGNYTNSFGGTSSAAPGVAGVVALMLAANPELTSTDVSELIRTSCDRIGTGPREYDRNGHSKHYGYGRINAAKAVSAAAAGPRRGPSS